jgi:hypothetical protein
VFGFKPIHLYRFEGETGRLPLLGSFRSNANPLDFTRFSTRDETGDDFGTRRALLSCIRQRKDDNTCEALRGRTALIEPELFFDCLVVVREEGRTMKTTHLWLAILVVCLIPVIAPAQEKRSDHQAVALSPYQSNPPTYSIPLMDGRTAIVWWDARNDSARPQWICEVPPRRDGSDAAATLLQAGRGDWRGALLEARTFLKDAVADGE